MNCYQFQTQIQQWFDGELSVEATAQMQDHLARCSACRQKYQQQKAIATALHQLPQKSCPNRVIRASYLQILRRQVSLWLKNLRAARWRIFPALQYGLVVGILLILVVLTTKHLLQKPVHHTPQYNAEQIKRGLEDAEWALSYLLYATQKSQLILQKEIMPQKIAAPIKIGAETTLKSLKIGGRL